MKSLVSGLLAATLWVTKVAVAEPLHVELEGERISVEATDEPLFSVLQELKQIGVRIKLDPSVNPRLTARVEHVELEQFLRQEISSNSFVCIWNSLPDGHLKLVELQVFRPGHQAEARPLAEPGRKLVGGAHGVPPYVEGEIVVALRNRNATRSVEALVNRLGGIVAGRAADGMVLRLRFPPEVDLQQVLLRIREREGVAAAEPNYAYSLPPGQAVERLPGGGAVGEVAEAEASGTASGPLVAVLDSGFSAPEGWTVPVAGNFNAVAPDSTAADPLGHGTQMALIASGLVSPIGVDPSDVGYSPILAIQAFDAQGVTSNFDLFRAIDYASANGAKVVSLSWGTETPSAFLAQAVQLAQDRGMMVVAAAGNEPSGHAVYPAAYPGVIAISATTPAGDLWDQSNYGDFVSFAAPGFARLPVGYEGPPGLYAGTSAATAYTAGLISRYLASHPDATAAEVQTALKDAASDAGTKGRDAKYGFGTLDSTAVQKLLAPTPAP